VSADDAFAKIVGRQPSEEERGRLYRLREALDLRDNDAFWAIVIALEYDGSFFRTYPDKLAERTLECIENARAAFAVAASHEARRAQRLLAERVAETSVEIARKLAERPAGVHHVTSILAVVVAFGALRVHAGYSLAIADKPWWVSEPGSECAGRASATTRCRRLTHSPPSVGPLSFCGARESVSTANGWAPRVPVIPEPSLVGGDILIGFAQDGLNETAVTARRRAVVAHVSSCPPPTPR
jgi:hypothetical protein